MEFKGIDVSKWNGNIDWQKMKGAGVNFAIIREGYGKKLPTQIDKKFKENIESYALEYPVVFDFEDKEMLKLTNRQRTDICRAFCEEIEKNGYYAMIYANKNWLDNYLHADELLKRFDLWLAQWNTEKSSYPCDIWQYSSTDATESYFEYTIQKNDTLWDLAQKYLGNGTRYKEIKTLNNLSSDTIYAGKTLKIPQ